MEVLWRCLSLTQLFPGELCVLSSRCLSLVRGVFLSSFFQGELCVFELQLAKLKVSWQNLYAQSRATAPQGRDPIVEDPQGPDSDRSRSPLALAELRRSRRQQAGSSN